MALTSQPLRRAASALAVSGLVALLAASSTFAATPVTVGYRDQTYGGGAARPSGDKPQSKLWYTDGTWFAGMFQYNLSPNPKSEYQIFRLNPSTHAWTSTGTVVDTRDTSHADYLWIEGTQTLYVASVLPVPDAIPTANTADGIRIYRYHYDATSNTYAAIGATATVPGTTTVPNVSKGGAPSVTIARDSTGALWVAWTRDNEIKYSKSVDNGVTWSTPAQVPVQAPNPVRNGSNSQHDSTAVIAFGTNVGIIWSDHDAVPSSDDDGFYFASIAAPDDPTVEANWDLEKLPTLLGGGAGESADNHVNIKATSDGSLYMVGKTGKDTANCATNQSVPLIEFFERTPAGSWSAHLVGTVGDCNTRPQLVISEQLDTAYVFLTSPNGGGTVYRKSAPLSGPDAFDFRGAADTTIQRGTPFIKSATETLIDDPSTTKQTVTSTSGIVVLANNLPQAATGNHRFYLHNEMSLPATDGTAPVGTVTINAGAVATATTTATVAVPATDAGSGVSLVRLSNVATVDGNGVLNGAGSTTFSYTTPIAWTLTAGEGTKTVYAQWRDSAGNWSTPVNDTIVLDTTAPTGTVVINGGDAATETSAVTLDLTRDDGSGSGVVSVLISNSTDFTGVTATAYADAKAWTLAAGGGTKTVYVKFVDAAGNVSASPVSDSINMTGLPFTDVTSFRTQIEWLYFEGITGGCTPTKFCPNDPVTRAQMAMFLVRALDLPLTAVDYFDDDDGKTGESSINALAESEITGGCGPRLYCPSQSVTRAQMAMFLVRALDLPLTAVDYFDDDDGKTGESSINALAEAGITGGCGPREYCPSQPVTRGQMAAFLYRALAD